eukprot:TRINITY_DN10606_c0_g1_i1.p1 TRINITY_DN10606_c0_g1~~TRINITY_DN10606_c0_g1_i1.p1  ORF type:complete len:513 (+),score=95.92 TRINITY_DN10606_c0_g1_i1:50-1588(+)
MIRDLLRRSAQIKEVTILRMLNEMIGHYWEPQSEPENERFLKKAEVPNYVQYESNAVCWTQYWKINVLTNHFNDALSGDELKYGYRLIDHVDMPRLVSRFCDMCGIHLAAGVLDKFEQTVQQETASCKEDVARDYRSYWTFVIADIQSLSPKIKHMNVIDFAEGSALLLTATDGSDSDTHHRYGAREIRALLHQSQQWLSAGHRMGTDFPESYLHLGEAFYQDAMTLPVHDLTATSLLRQARTNFKSCIKRDTKNISARFGRILVEFALIKYQPGQLTLMKLPRIDNLQKSLSQIVAISSTSSTTQNETESEDAEPVTEESTPTAVELKCALLLKEIEQQCNISVGTNAASTVDPLTEPVRLRKDVLRIKSWIRTEEAALWTLLVACALVQELETFASSNFTLPVQQQPEQQHETAPIPDTTASNAATLLHSNFVKALNLEQWRQLRVQVKAEFERRLPLLATMAMQVVLYEPSAPSAAADTTSTSTSASTWTPDETSRLRVEENRRRMQIT